MSSSNSSAGPSRSSPLNIPSGNSTLPSSSSDNAGAGTSPQGTLQAEDVTTGDRWVDTKIAVKQIDLKRDFENLGQIPCARSSLLYGIGGGVGIGAVRFLSSKRVWTGVSWSVLSFMGITIAAWEQCRAARRRELNQMRVIQERFPQRHVSNLKVKLPGEGGEPTKPQ